LHRRNAGNDFDFDVGPFRFRFACQQFEYHCRHAIDAGVAAGNQRRGPAAGGEIERQRGAGQLFSHRRLVADFTLG